MIAEAADPALVTTPLLIGVMAIWCLLAVLPSFILKSKGYDLSARLAALLLSLFVWPIALLVVLIMPPQTKPQIPRPRRRPSVQPQISSQFQQCPRCAQQNPLQATMCWNCQLPLVDAQVQPAPSGPAINLPRPRR